MNHPSQDGYVVEQLGIKLKPFRDLTYTGCIVVVQSVAQATATATATATSPATATATT